MSRRSATVKVGHQNLFFGSPEVRVSGPIPPQFASYYLPSSAITVPGAVFCRPAERELQALRLKLFQKETAMSRLDPDYLSQQTYF